MPEHHLARQSQGETQLPHFVLKEIQQRLEELQMQSVGQTPYVVVGLDRVRFLGLRARRLDDVGIDRALREPLPPGELLRLALEHFDELAPDDLPLLLRIRDPCERLEKAR